MNQVGDLSPLAGHSKLTFVDVSQNRVADLSPLTGPGSLGGLLASGNQIASLRGLHALTLGTLDVSHNQIVDPTLQPDIHFVDGSTGRGGSVPAMLDLSSNQIRDLSGLLSSAGVVGDIALRLKGNPLDCAAQADNIKKLRARVNFVETDCP
jgi:internalin A